MHSGMTGTQVHFMKLHFDSNQEYQIEASRAVTNIFEGQPLHGGDFEFSLTETGALLSENGVGNRLTLTEEQVWENVKRIQQRNLTPSPLSSRRGGGGGAGGEVTVGA